MSKPLYLAGDRISKKKRELTVITPWIATKHYKLAATSINLDVFNWTLNVAFGSLEEFKKFMFMEFGHKIEHESAIAMFVHFTDKNGVDWDWILLQRNDWTPSDYSTIVHELHHATHSMMEDMGVTYGGGGEEVFAYTQGWFMDQIVRAFVELKKTKYFKKIEKKDA